MTSEPTTGLSTEKRLAFRSGKPYPFSGGGVEILAATASPLENTLFTVAHESSGLTFKFDLVRRQLTPVLPELSVQVSRFLARRQVDGNLPGAHRAMHPLARTQRRQRVAPVDGSEI